MKGLRAGGPGYLWAILGVAAVTAAFAPFHDSLNNTTVALALLLVVLLLATVWGSGPALMASALGVLCFNFFFLAPLYTFTIADPQNWVALAAFFVVAVTAGALSARARRRTAEANAKGQEARRASAYNRSLLEASLDPLVAIGHDGEITDVNAATEAITGRARVELIGTDFSDYFTEPAKARAGYQQVFREGSVRDFPLEVRHRDGRTVPVLYNASVYRDETGEIIGAFAAARDITDRARAEAEVRLLARLQTAVAQLGLRALRNEWYESIVGEAVTLVAGTLDVEYTNVMELLPGGEELLLRAGVGWKEGSVGQATVSTRNSQPGYTVRSQRPVIVEDAATETRFVPLSRLLDEEVMSAMSVVITTRDGPYGALGAHTRRRRTFTEDEINFLQAVANVLGMAIERQRAADALRESEAKLNRAQEVAHVGSWYLDIARDRLTWSDEVFRIFGVARGTALTYAAFLAAIYADDREAVHKAWTAALWGAPYDVEHRLVVGGEVKWVRERALVEFDEQGTAVRGVGTVQDITERKRAERELLRINRAYRALSHCNQALIRATDEFAWLDLVCRLIVDEAGYRFCWVGRAEHDDARTVTPIAQAGFEEGYLTMAKITWADTEHGRGPTGTCIRTGETQACKDFATDPRLTPWRAEAVKRGYASSIAIPLMVDSETFGAFTIYSSEPAVFGDEEVMLLSELAGDLGYGVTTVRARHEQARAEEEIRRLNADLERRVIARTAELEAANTAKDALIVRERAVTAELGKAREREVAVGFRIQQTLLLDPPPRNVPGLEVAALSIPSQQIDGDFYDFFMHEDQSLDVIVADVMGKGIPAALLAAATKSQFRAALAQLTALSERGTLPEPREIVTLVHGAMVEHLIALESFVTLCYTRVDRARRQVSFVDCGHTGMIHAHARTGLCETLHGDNLPLGIREGEIHDQIAVRFEPGDLFLLYSDGITEAANTSGELFGPDRLSECVQANRKLSPEALVTAIRTAVLTFAGSDRLRDDLTCVAFQLGDVEAPVARAHQEILSDLRELRRAREFVRAFCAGLRPSPLGEDRTAALELAVNEAASNVMKHAYHGRADQRISLEAEAFADRVIVRLHHLGKRFDPSAVRLPAFDGSRESGFGIYLINQSVDEVRYYRDARGRNCIALMKFRAS